MINYLEAINLITQQPPCLGQEYVNIQDALTRVSATTLRNSELLPAFNNSAMDGFALKSAETIEASQDKPLQFKVITTIAAGDILKETNSSNKTSSEIMTGAAVPEEYDCIVRIEDVEQLKDDQGQIQGIRITRPIKKHENLRRIGEDFSKNEILVNPGQVINAQHMMAFAALGIEKVLVQKTPRIALICTGKEIIDDLSQKTLLPGQIRNANASYITSTLTAKGLKPTYYGSILDDPNVFLERMDAILNDQPDIIISTGAVSAGKWDFIPTTLKNLSAKQLFHKVKIKPGKPLLFSQLDQGPYYFGLPGNPISAAVGLRFFVYPLCRHLLGMPEEKPISALSLSSGKKKEGFRYFLKAHQHIDVNGKCQVEILNGQESFKINPMLAANCWAVFEEECLNYNKHDIINVYPF